MTTLLGAFNNQLIRFFEDLIEVFPEEKELKMGLEAIQGLKKVNPKLILDLYYEHIYREINPLIQNENEEAIIEFANKKISNDFNELSTVLMIFTNHWKTLSESNRQHIWKYLKVLGVLCGRAKGI